MYQIALNPMVLFYFSIVDAGYFASASASSFI
jgi:hypothetical protein